MTIRTTALAIAATLVSTGIADAQETLRFASFEGATGFITGQLLTPWAERVSAASDGTLDVQMFVGGTLGRDPSQQLQLVEDGVADIAWIIPGYTPGRFQEGTVVELPFVIDDSEAASHATWKMYEDGHFAGDYNEFKMIGIFASPTNFVAATKPIVEPFDMDGVSFRAPGPTLLAAVEELGAVPVGGISGPGIAEALSRGLIEGTSTQWGAVETFRLRDILTFYNTVPVGSTPMLVVMNKARYDALPDAAKAAIDQESGAAFSAVFGPAFDAHNAEVRASLEADGNVTIVDPDKALVQQWRDAMSVATSDWIAENENGQEIYDAFTAAIEDYNATN